MTKFMRCNAMYIVILLPPTVIEKAQVRESLDYGRLADQNSRFEVIVFLLVCACASMVVCVICGTPCDYVQVAYKELTFGKLKLVFGK